MVYKLAIAIVLAGACAVSGYLYGWNNQHSAFVSYRAKIEQAGADQAASVLEKDLENEKNAMHIAQSYASDNARMRANLNRLHSATTGTLPKDTVNAGGTDKRDGQRVGTCENTKFYRSALDCELKLSLIRKWVDSNRIPIREAQ